MDCTMCSKPIPEPRLLVVPHTLTCSPECARERTLWLQPPGCQAAEGAAQGCQGSTQGAGLMSGRCDAYGDGFSGGKAAAHFETRVWELGAHATDCGCRSCVRSCRRQVSRSCCPAGTSRTALALAAGRPAGAGATPGD